MKRSISSFCRALALLIAVAAPLQMASAWVLVYDLKFVAIGESINFRPFDGGYYLAANGGTETGGTLILFRYNGSVKNYYKYENFGEIFNAASNGASRKAVLTATAANEVSTSTFYAIGDATEKVAFDGPSATGFSYIAKELKGYSVSADSERDLPFAGDATDPYDLGVAGATSLTCTLNSTYTEDPTKPVLSLADTTTKLLGILEEAGYVDGNPTGGTTAGNATAGTTTAGSATAGSATAGTTTAGGRTAGGTTAGGTGGN
jgi:hypothetical protein